MTPDALDELVEAFAPQRHRVVFYRYTKAARQVADRDAVARDTYRDHFTSGPPEPDRAVAARARRRDSADRVARRASEPVGTPRVLDAIHELRAGGRVRTQGGHIRGADHDRVHGRAAWQALAILGAC